MSDRTKKRRIEGVSDGRKEGGRELGSGGGREVRDIWNIKLVRHPLSIPAKLYLSRVAE